VSAPAGHDDGTADLMALVAATRQDDREALRVLARFADRDCVLASAVKLLAEPADDLELCPCHGR
jgi:hypothetical protein